VGRIQRMDEALANKIAAGEVVERPASIVKELVENAMDAGAKSIVIEVEEGGLEKIKITDDGHGFLPEDCEIAFERHATSKIKSEQDLFRVRTLGFRGEALPSIASVSHFDLRSSTGTGPGQHLVLVGGRVETKEPSHSRKGTEMTITQLFYNTPARLKHLKTIHTELANISDIVNKLALANPQTRFHLAHNEKTMLKTNGNGDLAQVLSAIYGVETAKQSLELKGESLDFKIHGRLVKPMITRAGRNYVYIFINGRYIRHYSLFNALLKGYHTLLPIGRYPIAVLHIEMDPTLVDVNVHPAKLEARLSKEKELCELVESVVKDVFHKQRLIPEVKRPARFREVTEQQTLDFREGPLKPFQQTVNESGSGFKAQSSGNTFQRVLSQSKKPQFGRQEEKKFNSSYEGEGLDSPVNDAVQVGTMESQLKVTQPIEIDTDQVKSEDGSPLISYDEKEEVNSEAELRTDEIGGNGRSNPVEQIFVDSPPVEGKERVPRLYPIGQLHGTYILAQNEEGLYIIDQHAAQERIKYEFYREKVGETGHKAQELLFPITFDFTPSDYVVIAENQEILENLGLNFEAFGHHSFIVRSHPNWFPKGRERETIEAIVEELIDHQSVSIKKLREALAIMMSCKQSIKANRYLRQDEMEALLAQLIQAEDPFTCPHGRPVIVHFSTYEMEKLFKRVM
jgi:DNA mismatch repair protein MutL